MTFAATNFFLFFSPVEAARGDGALFRRRHRLQILKCALTEARVRARVHARARARHACARTRMRAGAWSGRVGRERLCGHMWTWAWPIPLPTRTVAAHKAVARDEPKIIQTMKNETKKNETKNK